MLKDNRNYNAQVTSNTAFLKTLRDKLPEFFTELDFLLTLHQRELDSLKKMKKSLLQMMFV